jgi:DNA-binding CsgD family transcriptional regulator
MGSKRRPKAPKREPRSKLKTMNEISAADAVKLFHACMVLDNSDPTRLYEPIPKGFPKDMVAGEFLEHLRLYKQMWADGQESRAGMYAGFYDDQRAALADIADRIPEEELKVLSDAERKVFDVFRNNRGISNKEIGEILNISEETVKDHISSICNKLGIREGRGRRRELAAKYPPNKT